MEIGKHVVSTQEQISIPLQSFVFMYEHEDLTRKGHFVLINYLTGSSAILFGKIHEVLLCFSLLNFLVQIELQFLGLVCQWCFRTSSLT